MKSNRTRLIRLGTLIALGACLGLFALGGVVYWYGSQQIADLPCAMSAADTRMTDAYMSYDSHGQQRTNVYAPDDQILYAQLILRCPYAETKVRAVLIAVNAEGTEPNMVVTEDNYVVASKDITGRNLNLWFRFGPNNQLWPPGQYRVDVYFNDALKTSIDFKIR